MKYKDSKSGISFLEVPEIGAEIPGGPLGISNTYHKNGDTIESIDEDGKVINAVDIDWNGAEVGDGVYLHTTGEVLNWIKTGKGSSGSSTPIQVDSETKVDTANQHLIHTMVIDGQPISIYQDTSLGGGAKNLQYVDETNQNSHSKIGTLQYGTQTINLYQDKTSSGGSSVVYSPNKTSGDLLGTILINGAANPIYSDKFEDKIGDQVVVTPKGNGTLEVATIKVGNKTKSIKVPAAANDPNPNNPNVGTSIEFSNLRASGTRIASVSLNGKAPFDLLAPVSEDSGFKLQSIDATATVDNTSGIPSVTVVKDGTESNPVFIFNFKGLKGATGVKGDTGATGPKGDKGDPGTYDDSELRNAINKNVADLNALLNQFDQRVTNTVENALNDAALIEKLFPDGGGGYSNFGKALNSATDKYLQVIGAWELNPTTGQKEYKWSKIEQGLHSLETTVGELQLNSGGTGGTTLTSTQLQNINDIDGIKTAVNQLSSNYAEFEGTDAKNLKVVRWLSSALGLYANESATWTDLASATENKTTGESAIAALQTRVTSLENGLVSDASLSTLVQDKVNQLTASSGFVTTSSLSETLENYATASSVATMYATIQDLDDSIDEKAGIDVVVTKAWDQSLGKYKVDSDIVLTADKVTFDADLVDLIASTVAVTKLEYYNNDNVLVGDVHVSQDGVAISGLAGVSINGTGGVNITGGNLSLSGTNLSFNITNGVDATNFNASYRHVGVSTSDTLGNIVSSLDSRLYTLESSGSSSVDWSDITNAPSIPSFAGYSETDLGDGDLHVTISGGSGGSSSDGVSITASGNGTVFVGGNDTTVSADADLLIDADNDITISASHDLKLSAAYSITANKEITTSSDERLKNVKSLLNPDIAEIAKTRIVTYQYKDNANATYLGAIAQDWENIFPDAVKNDKDGYKTFAYQSVALASAVTAAREIVALKEENKSLKSRVEALEKKIEALVDALN